MKEIFKEILPPDVYLFYCARAVCNEKEVDEEIADFLIQEAKKRKVLSFDDAIS